MELLGDQGPLPNLRVLVSIFKSLVQADNVSIQIELMISIPVRRIHFRPRDDDRTAQAEKTRIVVWRPITLANILGTTVRIRYPGHSHCRPKEKRYAYSPKSDVDHDHRYPDPSQRALHLNVKRQQRGVKTSPPPRLNSDNIRLNHSSLSGYASHQGAHAARPHPDAISSRIRRWQMEEPNDCPYDSR